MFVRSINGSTHTNCDTMLDEHYRLRARIFSQRMEWDVHVEDGLQKDAFDALDPTYILALTDDGRLAGCARLLPATGPTMLAAMFPDLVQSQFLRSHSAMIESSRFCVDTSLAGGRAKGLLYEATMTMFAGIIEWRR